MGLQERVVGSGTPWGHIGTGWGRARPCREVGVWLCPLSSPLGQQLWGQVGWRFRADCKFTWLCVALMSIILLFLIALLLGIVIHREC